MKTIWKYEITAGKTLEIECGELSEALKVQNIGGKIYMWFLHDNSTKEKVTKKYKVFSTGCLIEENIKYIDTFFVGDLVFHFCEII